VAHPQSSGFASGMVCWMRLHGMCVMMPAPSPESLSAEQAPRCSIQPRAKRAWTEEPRVRVCARSGGGGMSACSCRQERIQEVRGGQRP
jgi:hypothetical protein